MKKHLLVSFLLAFLCTTAPADNIRGRVAAIADPELPRSLVQVAPGDIVFIQSPGGSPLHTAVKIDISIPEAVAEARGAYAVYLYKGITPSPRSNLERYRGEKLEFLLLPPSRNFTIQIPYDVSFTGPESFDVVILEHRIPPETYPIALVILPVMKGIPARLAESEFNIAVGLVPSVTGILRLELTFPAQPELPYTVSIDGNPALQSAREYALAEGIHAVLVSSPHYSDQTRTFTVKSGAVATVAMDLKELLSTAFVEAPESAIVFLDGEKINHNSPEGLNIPAGEHSLLIKIGDYSLTKRFEVVPGLSYTIALNMDIAVETRER